MQFPRTTNHEPRATRRKRAGFTLVELIVVIAVIAVLGIVSLVNLLGRRNTSDLTATAQRMAALLREAQSRSVAQYSSQSWGVHFENTSSPAPFYALFSGASYSTSSQESRYPLSASVAYTTSTVPQNASVNILFSQISGAQTGSSSVGIYLLQSPSSSSTISVATSGAVSY